MLIPRPKYTGPEARAVTDGEYTEEDYNWIRWFINVPDWKCPRCGGTMFGRMEYCIFCKVRHNTHTPKPT